VPVAYGGWVVARVVPVTLRIGYLDQVDLEFLADRAANPQQLVVLVLAHSQHVVTVEERADSVPGQVVGTGTEADDVQVGTHASSSRSPSTSRYTFWSWARVSASGSAQRPRSAASCRRSTMPRRAHGFEVRRNSWLVSSRTYELASDSYIQSCTTPAVASKPKR